MGAMKSLDPGGTCAEAMHEMRRKGTAKTQRKGCIVAIGGEYITASQLLVQAIPRI
jgi:hypothetical protein